MRRERRMNSKCHSRSLCDTFGARNAELTGLKMRRITRAVSFDHLVGAGEQRRRQVEPERLGGLEIDHQLEFDRLQPARFDRCRDNVRQVECWYSQSSRAGSTIAQS